MEASSKNMIKKKKKDFIYLTTKTAAAFISTQEAKPQESFVPGVLGSSLLRSSYKESAQSPLSV